MSYTEMFKVPESGPVQSVAEFKNAFLGAMHVWAEMAETYLQQDAGHLMFHKNMQPVWDLWKDKKVPLDFRITMLMTFDNVMARKQIFIRLAEAMVSFANEFGPGSLREQADMLRTLVNDDEAYAVCWNQTSVNASPWWVYGDGDEEGRAYDISKDEKHWFLSDALEEIEESLRAIGVPDA